jgi:hypothetical protein
MTGIAATTTTAQTSRMPAIQFVLLALAMLATPLILFAIGVAKDSVFLVDGSGALFGIDTVLLIWLRDERNRAHGGTTIPR